MTTIRSGLRALLVVAIAFSGFSARAWSPATRIRMADEAVRLMPASLRLALEHRRQDVLRGVLEPMTDEDSPAHRPSRDGGTLEDEIASRVRALEEAVRNPKSFGEIARAFGALAHFVSDAGFPPAASGKSGADRYADFGKFCETRMGRFPLVFYGHAEEASREADLRAFAGTILDRARAQDADLARAYAQAGTPPDPAAFDDRSVPFAVGSLAYSRSVTDVVRAWLVAWGGASGDLRGTPYLPSARVYRR